MMIGCLAIGVFAMAVSISLPGDDPKEPTYPVVLKVTTKNDKYVFNGGGKTPKEYKAALEELVLKQASGERIKPPKALAVDLVLTLENTSKENVTVYVKGTANTHTFELTGGDGIVTLRNTNAMPDFIRLPTAVTLEPGKSYEMSITTLADGRRGTSRLIFWTGPGEYMLTTQFVLLDQHGSRLKELKSEPIKINVVEK
jgi:ribonucleotide monophosphatase NagD (HAD superfamily)